MKIKMLKGDFKRSVFEARFLRKSLIDVYPLIQILEGPLMGEIIPFEHCIQVVGEESLSDDKRHEITTKIDEMIAEWQSSDYEGSPIADRKAFSKRLTDFIIKELT